MSADAGRPRALFVCPFVPWPADDGGRIRTSNLAAELSRTWDLELWCIAPPEGVDGARIAALAERIEGGRVRVFERSQPGLARRLTRAKLERWFTSEALERALGERLRTGGIDLLHLDELLLARMPPLEWRGTTVVHHHKLDREFAASVAATEPAGPRRALERALDRVRLGQLEAAAARRFPFQITCSEGDRTALQSRHPRLSIAAVPSGYDPAHFAANPDVRREPDTLLYLGHMGYAPNVDAVRWFATEVLPLLLERRPQLRLTIVGREPDDAVRALEQNARVGGRIRVTGAVDDVRPYLWSAAVMVVPLRIGGGTRLKLAEALACATPCVATPVGAEGLGLEDGRHLRLAADAPAFAAATAELLGDPERAAELALDGSRFVAGRYRWGALAERVSAHWHAAIADAAGRTHSQPPAAAKSQPSAAAKPDPTGASGATRG